MYKFQKLEVYQLGLEFVDKIYELTNYLPESERLNLCSQVERVAISAPFRWSKPGQLIPGAIMGSPACAPRLLPPGN